MRVNITVTSDFKNFRSLNMYLSIRPVYCALKRVKWSSTTSKEVILATNTTTIKQNYYCMDKDATWSNSSIHSDAAKIESKYEYCYCSGYISRQ